MSGPVGLPPPYVYLMSSIAPALLHCHDGAAYTVVRVVDSLYVSFPGALPALPLCCTLTPMGMDEWPDAAPPVTPPHVIGVDDAASDYFVPQ